MRDDPPPGVALIDRPLACTACGYNLFGLRRDGRCPECGTPALDSLRRPAGLLLRPDLDVLLAGAGWLAAATLLVPVGIVVVFARLTGDGLSPLLLGSASLFCFLGLLIAAVLAEKNLYAFARKHRLQDGPPVRVWACAAAGGLLFFAADGLFLIVRSLVGSPTPVAGFSQTGLLAVAFGLSALGCWRFLAFYRRHGRLLALVAGSNDARFLDGYGVWKVVIDGWLLGSVFLALVLTQDVAGIALCMSLPALFLYALTWIVEVTDRIQLLARVARLRSRAPAAVSADVTVQ